MTFGFVLHCDICGFEPDWNPDQGIMQAKIRAHKEREHRAELDNPRNKLILRDQFRKLYGY